MMTSRKRISIHDYPEHLNPFSEPVPPSPTTNGKLIFFEHKTNKNGDGGGTWSSKISKRVSRSVTWIEKSWPGAETINFSDRHRRRSDRDEVFIENNASRVNIENKNHPVPPIRNSQKSELFHQQDNVREQIVHTTSNSSTNSSEKRQEIKKRKKRRAPPPPSPPLVANPSRNSVSNSDTIPQPSCTVSKGQEDKSSEDIPKSESVISDISDSNSVEKLVENETCSKFSVADEESSVICSDNEIEKSNDTDASEKMNVHQEINCIENDISGNEENLDLKNNSGIDSPTKQISPVLKNGQIEYSELRGESACTENHHKNKIENTSDVPENIDQADQEEEKEEEEEDCKNSKCDVLLSAVSPESKYSINDEVDAGRIESEISDKLKNSTVSDDRHERKELLV